MVKQITICDSGFINHSKSASIGGDNLGLGSPNLKWIPASIKDARVVTGGHIKDAPAKGQVAWLIEPYELRPTNYRAAFKRRHEFDFIITHDKYFASFENFRYAPYGGSWIAFDDWGMHKKTKFMSMIMSDKDSTTGHMMRREVARVAKEILGNHIDIFGYGINPIKRKFDALAPYKYSIVIESSNRWGYFSEKLIDCLSVGTMPIYWGASVYYDVDDKGILLADTTDMFELWLRIVLQTNDGKYDKFDCARNQRYANIDNAKKYRFTEDHFYEWL